MTFKDYYKGLGPHRLVFREAVTKKCYISLATFYNWLKKPESITQLGKEKIKEINPDIKF